VQNLQILMISAVQICKQCLQTISASVVVHQTATEALPLDPTEGLPDCSHSL